MFFVCVERSLYWAVWLSATIYALYQFARVCQTDAHHYRLNAQDFKPGTLTSNPYDASDFEWQSFKKLYINYWYIVFIHFGLSNVFTAYNRPALKLASWTLVTLYATYTVFSFSALLVVVINVIMLILMAVLGKNILSYALCFGVVLASQSTEIANRIFNSNDPRQTNEFDFEEKRFLFTYCICFLNARGLSSSVDNLTVRQKKEFQSGKGQFCEKLITIIAYLLYLPGFFAGPIYLYNDFERATRLVKTEPTKEAFLGSSYSKSMTAIFILIGNLIYYEWLLHWLYSSAASTNSVLTSGYNAWQFCGLTVSLCILFYMKYTCMYRTFKVLATLDGVASISPSLPQCPAAMHLSSQLWRHFDVGIYVWLRKYIYDPIAKPSSSLFLRLVATLVCFFAIAMWHLPLTPNLIMWIGLNIISAFVEVWAKALGNTSLWLNISTKLGRANYLRVLAILGLPMFVVALFSNLLFLSSSDSAAHEFLKRLIQNQNHYAPCLLFVLFCGVNVSIDYNRLVPAPVDLAQCHGFPCRRQDVSGQAASKSTGKCGSPTAKTASTSSAKKSN